MTIDTRLEMKNYNQYDIIREAPKISSLSLAKIDKYDRCRNLIQVKKYYLQIKEE